MTSPCPYQHRNPNAYSVRYRLEVTTRMSKSSSLRAAVVLALVGAASGHASIVLPGHMVIYRDGAYVSTPVERLRADEAYGRQGHMPWRQLPLEVASVDAAQALLPAVAPGWKTTSAVLAGRAAKVSDGTAWVLIAQHDGKAMVRVFVNRRPYAEVRLIRPWDYWWYVVSVRRIDVPRTRIVFIHPHGVREFLPGPLILRRGRAYLPLRDLRRCSIMSEWDPAKRTAKVYLEESDAIFCFRAERRLPQGSVPHRAGRSQSWTPFVYRGRMYVSATGIAELLPRFKPVWSRSAECLELYIIPLRSAGV